MSRNELVAKIDRWTVYCTLDFHHIQQVRYHGFQKGYAGRLQGLYQGRFQPPLYHQRMRKGPCLTADQSNRQEAPPFTSQWRGQEHYSLPSPQNQDIKGDFQK